MAAPKPLTQGDRLRVAAEQLTKADSPSEDHPNGRWPAGRAWIDVQHG